MLFCVERVRPANSGKTPTNLASCSRRARAVTRVVPISIACLTQQRTPHRLSCPLRRSPEALANSQVTISSTPYVAAAWTSGPATSWWTRTPSNVLKASRPWRSFASRVCLVKWRTLQTTRMSRSFVPQPKRWSLLILRSPLVCLLVWSIVPVVGCSTPWAERPPSCRRAALAEFPWLALNGGTLPCSPKPHCPKGQIPDAGTASDALSVLIEALDDPSSQRRLAAVNALANTIEHPGAKIALAGALTAPDRMTRFAAASRLAQTDAGRAILHRAAASNDSSDAASMASEVLWANAGSLPGDPGEPGDIERVTPENPFPLGLLEPEAS